VIVTAAGLNIYPEDLEEALKKQPAIRDAVVVPVVRNGNAEASAYLLPIGAATQAQIQVSVAAANASLAEYQQIRKWSVWPEPDFPRTPTGKPRLSAIAAYADSRSSTTASDASGATASGDPISSLAAANLASLSSLDRVELLSSLEQRYNIEIDEEEYSQAKSVDDLRRLVAHSSQRSEGRGSELDARYYYPRWTQREPVRFLRLLVYYALVWPATQLLGHPRVVGREHLRGANGPLIVVSNHITRRADIGLILAALPARFRHRLASAMGGEALRRMSQPPREWLFVKRWGYQVGYWLVKLLFNVFPLPQSSEFRHSFRFAGESVDRGYSVLIFPEGIVNNSNDGRMAPFQSGIGLLAENLGLPIVPMRLDGVWQMKKEHRRLARRDEITVCIGKPVTFPRGTSPEQIARELEAIVLSL